MADLGNLNFGVHLKNYTEQEYEAIKKKLVNMHIATSARVGLKVDVKEIEDKVEALLKNKTYKVKLGVDNESIKSFMESFKGKGMTSDELRGIKGFATTVRMDADATYKRVLQDIRKEREQLDASIKKEREQLNASLKRGREQSEALLRAAQAASSTIRADAYANTQMKRADAYASSQKALEQLRIARMQAAKASDTHNAAMKRTNTTMSSQSRIAGELKNQIANVYSIYTLERFVRGLYTIGGEFQKQRIALTSIIGDSMKAETIFNRIKDLAVVSPFQFKELASYAKQLSAYSIPYEELYDTTKRLADISAGVGVDMGRIILAYGQVRSAAFLRGQELRQFTEAGIPLVDELAKRFTKLTGVVTSAGDVFDKISRKEVSFGMVKDVLWELTDEGGKFYNMQEALAESLAGKWSNLQDAWDVMMADIAESNSGVLSDSLELLTDLMKHWEAVADILGILVGLYGSYKTAVIAVNVAQKSSFAISQMQAYYTWLNKGVKVTKAAAVAQWALNSAMKVNPWVFWITTLGAIVTTLTVFQEKVETVAEKTKKLNIEFSKNIEKIKEEESKAKGYISRIFDKTNGIDAQRRAYLNLQKIYPSLFENMKFEQFLLEGEYQAIQKVLSASKEREKVKSAGLVIGATNNRNEAQRELNRLKSRREYYQSLDGYENVIESLDEDIKKQEEVLSQAQKTLNDALENYSTYKIKKDDKNSAWFKKATELYEKFGIERLKPDAEGGLQKYIENIIGANEDASSTLSEWTKKEGEWNEETRKSIDKAKLLKNATDEILKTFGRVTKETQNTKDPIAEQWEARTDLIDKAVSSYEKWRKIEGDEAATQRVKGISEFSSVFDEKGVNLDLNNPSKAYKYIQGQLDRSKEKQEDLYISLGVKIDKAGIDSAKQEVDNALKEIERYISESGKKWDLYKQLFDITGSREQSMSIAFGGEIGFDSLIDELKAKLRKKTGAYSDMPVDIVLGLDEKAIREKFGKSANEILSLQKEINDKIQEKNDFSLIDEQKTIMEFASIEKKIEAVKGKYQELIDSATTQEGKEAYTQKMNKEIQELNDESIKLLPLWQKLFGDTTNMGYNNLRRLVNEAKKFSESAIEQKDPITGKSQFELTDNDNKKHILSLEEYLRLLKQIEKTQNELNSQNPFQGVIDGFQKLKAAEGEEEKQDALKVIGSNANAAAQMIQGVTEAWANMFSAFGNDDLADTLGLVGELTGELGSLVEGLTSGNPIQMASSALSFIPNIIGSIAKAHDKKLDRAIEKSKLRAQELQNVYDAIERSLEHFLGSGTEMKLVDAEKDRSELIQLNSQIEAIRKKDKLNIFDEVALSRYSKEAEKLNKRVSAYDEGGAYGYQRALMEEQISELEKQKQAELDKKDVDQSKVADYEAQIAEMQQQVKDFAEETAETLYGIDLKGWASELGDALYEAWQKGENGAEAFRNKVADIMGSVMNSVLKIGVLEPAMKQLQAMLFGEDGMSGYFGKDFSLDSKEVKGIADYLMSLDKKTDAYYSALDEVDAYMKKRYGVSLKESEKNSSSLSKGIQENITEETANILASYINGIRADVSIKRTLQERFFKEDFPKMNVIAEAQLRQLSMITENTRRTADSNEAILNEVSELRNEIHSAKLTKDKGFYFR